MLVWAASWLQAADQASRAALSQDFDGRAQGVLAVLALDNAVKAVRKGLTGGHKVVQELTKATRDLAAMRDMLAHFEDYQLGEGKLQRAAAAELENQAVQAGHEPGTVPWWVLWGGASSEHQEITILTHTDASGIPTSFRVNIQDTVQAVAEAVSAFASELGDAVPQWITDLTPARAHNGRNSTEN